MAKTPMIRCACSASAAPWPRRASTCCCRPWPTCRQTSIGGGVHIGGGALLDELRRQAATAGLGDRIEWRGAQDQAAVIQAYLDSDLFVLPARIAADGDRDGLPNVLMEAQATGLACLSTRVSAIPELITDGETGRLIDPDDIPALTAALKAAIADPAGRRSLGAAGAGRVRRDFAFTPGLDRLSEKFGMAAPAERPGPA